MSISDDKVILHPDTIKQIGDICAPQLKGLNARYADKLEQEADRLEIEAETKRYLAKLIRTGVTG